MEFPRRYSFTRRDFIRASAALGGLAFVDPLDSIDRTESPGRPNPAELPDAAELAEGTEQPAETRSHSWVDTALILEAGSGTRSERAYVSQLYRPPFAFNAIGSLWSGKLTKLEVRGRTQSGDWSIWQQVNEDDDRLDGSADGREAGALVDAEDWEVVQYRQVVPLGSSPADVELVFVDSLRGPKIAGPVESPEIGKPNGLAMPAALVSKPTIISRAGWGANERYRFDASGREKFPRTYKTWSKAVVHHTVTSNTYTNAAAQVRAVYYYQAISRGWGDVGYNYLVDRFGNVYAGRYGGTNVVGRHVAQYSAGSAGIACLGTFGPGSSIRGVYPSTAMKRSLDRIVAWACRDLNPYGRVWAIRKYLPVICAHRDVFRTNLCPGSYLYAYMPTLRKNVKALQVAS